ncbi:MAG: bifunctional UDP-N-acetylglucosamine diphosphorylase/glucosamine-1-phosphate N-acetyltransferase GlmU [Gammaproteobacteria bacterium]|nr:bifunctional UDP-N-acetylglucosamine diphosphorylase/glucosamine-1-phosphate N-acetyltransferase GlmU [Gammaproteobacteria bacterium]MCH9763489.1 bifunctional UDP-N-acetylglucosamine diphosphorylase/glucosamine-1-phosphate N-acetyltransferase GlmU [Gammaproteobacteria bacterium]
MALHVVILAAGQGTRMYSKTPKVLHTLAGQPMLGRVLNTAKALNPAAIHVIVGHEHERIQQAFSDHHINWVLQEKQLGTGHALMQALPHIPTDDLVLVLSGDVPLIQLSLLEALLERAAVDEASGKTPLVLLLALLSDPTGLGRVLRDENGSIHALVEEKDATEAERKIQEIYSGMCCAKASDLGVWLPRLSAGNVQEEYYLTDIIEMAATEQHPIGFIHVSSSWMIQGVNDRRQLQDLERVWQERQAIELMKQGATVADAKRLDIRGTLNCGQDVFLDVGLVLSGELAFADGVQIGPHCVLTNVKVGPNTRIEAHSVLENCEIGANCSIGPFARIRPGTVLGDACKIGNFVEIKQAVFGEGSKASHLSYLGDVLVGKQVNIGAGTITCNYDGVNKHQTIIEDGAFIGSDTQLVAPVTVGKNATIGAGTTLRRAAPADELTLTTSQQKTLSGWKRPKKREVEKLK